MLGCFITSIGVLRILSQRGMLFTTVFLLQMSARLILRALFHLTGTTFTRSTRPQAAASTLPYFLGNLNGTMDRRASFRSTDELHTRPTPSFHLFINSTSMSSTPGASGNNHNSAQTLTGKFRPGVHPFPKTYLFEKSTQVSATQTGLTISRSLSKTLKGLGLLMGGCRRMILSSWNFGGDLSIQGNQTWLASGPAKLSNASLPSNFRLPFWWALRAGRRIFRRPLRRRRWRSGLLWKVPFLRRALHPGLR